MRIHTPQCQSSMAKSTGIHGIKNNCHSLDIFILALHAQKIPSRKDYKILT